jgi:hypothetical protein
VEVFGREGLGPFGRGEVRRRHLGDGGMGSLGGVRGYVSQGQR